MSTKSKINSVTSCSVFEQCGFFLGSACGKGFVCLFLGCLQRMTLLAKWCMVSARFSRPGQEVLQTFGT